MHLKLLLLLVIADTTLAQYSRRRPQFRVAYEWTTLDFEWPTTQHKARALSSGDFIPENNIISGIEYYYNRIFLTVPRYRHGVPATLTWVPAPNISSTTAPVLTPYPDWDANTIGNCRSLQNVQSVKVDASDTLWVIDGGKVDTLEEYSNDPKFARCPPKLVLFDLRSNQRTREFVFPNEVVSHGSHALSDFVIDDFEGRYAYITDSSAQDPGIVVYSFSENVAWKVRDPGSMTAVPDASNLVIGTVRFTLASNINGIALGPLSWGPGRDVFYTPLSSYSIFSVSSEILRNRVASRDRNIAPYVRESARKSSQTDGMIMDEDGLLYYGLLSESAIGQWNTTLPFETSRLVAKDPSFIQWSDSFAIDLNGNLYLVTNGLHNYIRREVRSDQINFRILVAHIGSRSYLYGDGVRRGVPTGRLPYDDGNFLSSTLQSRFGGLGQGPSSLRPFDNNRQSRLYPGFSSTEGYYGGDLEIRDYYSGAAGLRITWVGFVLVLGVLGVLV